MWTKKGSMPIDPTVDAVIDCATSSFTRRRGRSTKQLLKVGLVVIKPSAGEWYVHLNAHPIDSSGSARNTNGVYTLSAFDEPFFWNTERNVVLASTVAKDTMEQWRRGSDVLPYTPFEPTHRLNALCRLAHLGFFDHIAFTEALQTDRTAHFAKAAALLALFMTACSPVPLEQLEEYARRLLA